MGVVIVEGEGAVFGWIWDVPLQLMRTSQPGSSQITLGRTCCQRWM